MNQTTFAHETIVAQGIDTLVIGYCCSGEINSDWLELMSLCKEEAQKPSNQGNFPLQIAGIDGVIMAYGSKGYEFVFENSDFSARIASKMEGGRIFPEIMITFRSNFLWRAGAKNAVPKIHRWIESLGPHIDNDKVSRIDLAVDLREELPVLPINDKSFQGRMKKKRDFTAAAYAEGHNHTGYMMGSGAIVARVYDKTHEIILSDKKWMENIWLKHGFQEGDKVTRVEFQLRREAIIEFLGKVESGFDAMIKAMPDIWRYCTQKWFTIHKKNESDTRISRWPVIEFWKTVQSATMMFGELSGILRFHQAQPKIKHLMKMIQGCLLSASALCGNTDKIFNEVKSMSESLEFAGLLPARQAKLALIY